MAPALPTASTQMQRQARNRPKPPTRINPAGMTGKIGQETSGITPAPGSKQQVINMQRFLNAKGYHVSVDGVLGPQTRAAVADWHTGPKNRPLLSKHTEATDIVLSGKNPPKGKSGGGGGVAPKGGGGSGVKTAASNPASGYKMIDPKAYATAAANEAYGPVIAELLNQQTQTKAQGAQNQTDITGWINQLMGTQKEGAAGDAAALAKAVGQNQQDVAGIAGLFGDTGGHDLEGIAANNLANLRAQGQTTGDFDRHMAAVLQAQGVDQHMAAQHATDASLTDLANKLVAQKAAKGQSYNKALQDAYGTRLQQEAAIQNMQLAGQMAPVQLATAKANLAATQSRTVIAEKQAELAGKQAALQNKVVQAQLRQFKQTQSGEAIPFHTLQAGDRLKLTAAITKGIRSNLKLGKMGTGQAQSYKGNHKVWGAIKAMLSPYDTSDPDVRKFALGILKQLANPKTMSNFN